MYPLPIKEEILKNIEQLPTLPHVVTRIMQLIESPTTAANDISRVIAHDSALTVKILKIVNSAYYGFPKAIRTISHAIMILGFEDVKNIALSISVFDIFKNDKADARKGFSREEFWRHSIAVGVCTKLLAKKLRMRNLEEAFIAGLLHDIGKIALDQYFHSEFEQIMIKIREEKILFVNAERMLLDLDHAEIGMSLGKQWQLPEQIVNCIGYHHDPHVKGENSKLIAIVHAADIFVRIQKIGSGWDELVPQLKKEAWQQIQIKPTDLQKIYKQLHEDVDKADAFMEFTKSVPEDKASFK